MQKLNVLVGISALAAASLSSAQVTVWVDFTSDIHGLVADVPNGKADWIDELDKATSLAGVTTFSASERTDIQDEIISQLGTMYLFAYDITFTTTMPSSGPFDAIAFGKKSFGFSSLGIAPNDPMNIASGQVAAVATGNFDFILDEFDGSDFRSDQIFQISTALAGTGAHELGHTFGLNHHHAYSDPSITPATYAATGGEQNTNIMATASTGLDELGREALRALGPWEMAMLDFAGGATAAYPTGFDHQKLVTDPVEIMLAEVGPPDVPASLMGAMPIPLTPGETSGMMLAMVAGDLDGSAADADMYKIFVPTPSLLTAELFSDNRFAGPFDFDTRLHLFDGMGGLIAMNDDVFHEGDVFGAVTYQQDDSFLLNIPLMPGVYHLLVDGSPMPSIAPGADDAYWLAIGVSPYPIPEPASLGLLGLSAVTMLRRTRR